jgi:hypothetical protein
MPDRYATPKSPRDHTGHVQHLQYMKHQEEVERNLQRQREQIQAEQDELAARDDSLPREVFVNYEPSGFIDYTTPASTHQPVNAPRG